MWHSLLVAVQVLAAWYFLSMIAQCKAEVAEAIAYELDAKPAQRMIWVFRFLFVIVAVWCYYTVRG